ncbi:hypothetical protein E2C01_021537 [Portunus trituberculatus]|uniref:Uncharacterized protein n=1 Tax=Portunus trituberculatus TaxID=210409 RepID=A0A5B7E575_PORTR|nr:hypothetical protein [Portunus trituberculatus]
MCVPPKVIIRTGRLTTIRYHSLSVVGPKLYNSLPGYLRNSTNVSAETFKNRLDMFLKFVPDEPSLDHYRTPAHTNSIDDQLRYLRNNSITIQEEPSPCPGSPYLPINTQEQLQNLNHTVLAGMGRSLLAASPHSTTPRPDARRCLSLRGRGSLEWSVLTGLAAPLCRRHAET